jgi:integrase
MRKKTPKRVLASPDLEHARSAVLSSLTSRSGQRTYDHAIREFVGWYCSEPRLAFNRTVVLRDRIHLEQRQYAPATINLRLAAVRRVAYEAADAGLLSPELAAGIRRVKSVRRLGVRLGNWLTPEQGRRLLDHPEPSTPRQLRDHAMLAMLIGCGLRRVSCSVPVAMDVSGAGQLPLGAKTFVGVVGDAVYRSVREPASPTLYSPWRNGSPFRPPCLFTSVFVQRGSGPRG